jgi:hypothetical protein
MGFLNFGAVATGLELLTIRRRWQIGLGERLAHRVDALRFHHALHDNYNRWLGSPWF